MASLSNSRHPITVLCTRRHLNITGVEQETSYEWHGSFISMAILDEACLKICSNTDLKFKEAKKTLAFFIVVAIEDYKTEITTIRGGKWNILEVGMSMAVKLTKSTPKYTKAPRWEREGILYKADRGGDVNAKYTMTLLGMPTIFLEPTEQVSAIFESRNQIQKTDLTRFLAARPRVIIKQNDLIKYTWGQTDSPIHSVPDMKDTDRVFVSVVFGSAREIRDMCRKQSLVYRECDPRGALPSRRLAEQFAGYIFDQA